MKRIFLLLGFLSIFIAGCYVPPECETYSTGDVTFHDNGPSYVWSGMYIEVDWSGGSYSSGSFYYSKTYFDKPAGYSEVYMEWEDADYYYWSTGYFTVYECSDNDVYCTYSKKKSTNSGQILKSDFKSKEEFRQLNKH